MMKGELFLTSTLSYVAEDVGHYLKAASCKKIAFITTASEVEEGEKKWLKDDRDSLIKQGFEIEDYTITGKNQAEVREKLLPFDAICVAGGNTFYLLEKTLESGFDKVAQEFLAKGKPYIGSSAGSLLAGPDISPAESLDDAKEAPNLKTHKSIGLTDIVVLPHWGNPLFKALYLNQRLEGAYKKGNKIILLTDDQYIHIKGETYQIIDVKANF